MSNMEEFSRAEYHRPLIGNQAGLAVLCRVMLTLALVFAVIALIFGILGFSGLAHGFATIARFLLALFLILFVLTLLFGSTCYVRRPQPTVLNRPPDRPIFR